VKSGIFGGTFDPPHHGHLIAAEFVREQQNLDRILFVPNSIPPNKSAEGVSPPQDRLAMLRHAVRNFPLFEVSDIEISRGGISYTVDTIRLLKKLFPADELHLIIGVDNLVEFDTWKDPEEILGFVHIIAMSRPGTSESTPTYHLRKGVSMCKIPLIDISATDIRWRVGKGLPIRYLVPAEVEKYIKEKGLYSGRM
jgi:nicotinate-nucleotide adenylyltransferase